MSSTVHKIAWIPGLESFDFKIDRFIMQLEASQVDNELSFWNFQLDRLKTCKIVVLCGNPLEYTINPAA